MSSMIETKRKQQKPRRPAGETLDLPRRYLVRSAGIIRIANVDSPERAKSHPSDEARLMGTHETEQQAIKRLGWA